MDITHTATFVILKFLVYDTISDAQETMSFDRLVFSLTGVCVNYVAKVSGFYVSPPAD